MSAKNTNANATIKPNADYTVGQMATMLAARRGIDTSRAAKDVRRRLRANFANVVKLDPRVSEFKKSANDGNRWPVVNGKVAALVLTPNAKGDK